MNCETYFKAEREIAKIRKTIEERKIKEASEKLKNELIELTSKYPEINTLEDIFQLPFYENMYKFMYQGFTVSSAFVLAKEGISNPFANGVNAGDSYKSPTTMITDDWGNPRIIVHEMANKESVK